MLPIKVNPIENYKSLSHNHITKKSNYDCFYLHFSTDSLFIPSRRENKLIPKSQIRVFA